MKKLALIFSIVLSILSFISLTFIITNRIFWIYINDFFSVMRFFSIDIMIAGIISIIGLILSCLLFIIKEGNKFLKVIPIVLFSLTLIFCFYPSNTKIIKNNIKKYENCIPNIDNKSKINEELLLSKKCSNLSQNGKVVVSKDKELNIVGFWEFKSSISGSILVVYSPNGKAEINKHFVTKQTEKITDNWYYIDISGNVYY